MPLFTSNNKSYNLRVRNDFKIDDSQIPIIPSTSNNTSYNVRRVRNDFKKDESIKFSVVARKRKVRKISSSTADSSDDSLDLQINKNPKKSHRINKIKKCNKAYSSQHKSAKNCNVNCNTKKRNNNLEEEQNKLLSNTISRQRTKNKQKLQQKINSTNSILEQTHGYISKQGVAELLPFVKLNMRTEQEIFQSKKVNDNYNVKRGHNSGRPDKNEQLPSVSSMSDFRKQNCIEAEISKKRNLILINEKNVEIDQKMQKTGHFPSSPTVEHIRHENMEKLSNKNDRCETTNEIRTIFKHFYSIFGNLLTPQTTIKRN